jgi:hypothetical protein
MKPHSRKDKSCGFSWLSIGTSSTPMSTQQCSFRFNSQLAKQVFSFPELIFFDGLLKSRNM